MYALFCQTIVLIKIHLEYFLPLERLPFNKIFPDEFLHLFLGLATVPAGRER